MREELSTVLNNEQMRKKHIGINNIIAAGNVTILGIYDGKEYDDYIREVQVPQLYTVRCYMTVEQTDEFNMDGDNYYVIICGNGNGSRKVADVILPTYDLVETYEQDKNPCNEYIARRLDANGISSTKYTTVEPPIADSRTSLPSRINVKRIAHGNGEIVRLILNCTAAG